MSENADKGLLPAGLFDVLAPDAAFEASVLERLLADFAAHGFDRVAPPLIEFEDSLLTGIGAGLAEQTFRLMDPESQKMMGVRADMTPQVLEVNPDHTLFQGLAERAKKGDGQDPLIADAAHLLLDQARIVEGEALADPQAFLRRMTAVMESRLKV